MSLPATLPKPLRSANQNKEVDSLPVQNLSRAPSEKASGTGPPLSRAELEALYVGQRLSLQQIADTASEGLGISVTRAKVREWLLWHRIPRRSFAEAAQVKFEKRRATTSEKERLSSGFAQGSLF